MAAGASATHTRYPGRTSGWSDGYSIASIGAVGLRNVAETAALWAQAWSPDGMGTGRSLDQIDLGYQYHSAAVIQDGSPEADRPGSSYTPKAAPGSRAPHLWLGGQSTLDLLGADSTLIAANHSWATVPVHVITEPGFPELYGVTTSGAVLVRPDGYVAWRSPTAVDDTKTTIRAILKTILGR